MTFTREDALNVIKATKNGVRPPRANPNPDGLASDLNKAVVYFQCLKFSSKAISQGTSAWGKKFKNDMAKLHSKTAGMIHLLEPLNKNQTPNASAWNNLVWSLHYNKKYPKNKNQQWWHDLDYMVETDEDNIKHTVDRAIKELLSIREFAGQIKDMPDTLFGYEVNKDSETEIFGLEKIAKAKKAEFSFVMRMLPQIYYTHFNVNMGITIRPKEGAGTKFIQACLKKMDISISNGTLEKYWKLHKKVTDKSFG